MSLGRKIASCWLGLVILYALAFLFLAHGQVASSVILNRFLFALLGLTSAAIAFREPNRQNRYIFLNFGVAFLIFAVQLLSEFIGYSLFTGSRYGGFFFTQYSSIAYMLLFAAAVVYLVIDSMFRDFKIWQKYLVASLLVGAFSLYYFYPYLDNPLYLYSTEDIRQWKTLDEYQSNPHVAERLAAGENLTAVEISGEVKLQSWDKGVAVGDLYPEENIRRIEELLPYLEGNNWMVLMYKPFFLTLIHMNVMAIGFIIIFFGYQYKKDPPQGAYIDKLMFLFLLLASMEILHNWGFIKSVEWNSYAQLATVGQYISLVVEMLLLLFFSLRLRFITSVQGEFYETELANNPTQVTRWIDWIDEFVLSHFFKSRPFHGRLFQSSSESTGQR
jgi:hypothetical protein